MEETNKDFLLFVYEFDARQIASVVTLFQPYYMNDENHGAWVLGKETIRVTWGQYFESRLISYAWGPDYFAELCGIVEHKQRVNIRSSQLLPPVPFYISSNPEQIPITYEVLVRFHFETLDFLPQIKLILAANEQAESSTVERARRVAVEATNVQERPKGWFATMFDRFCGNGSINRETPIDQDFDTLARSRKPFPGLRLPVFLAGDKVPGVLQLEQKLAPHLFRAVFYLSATPADVRVPIELVSRGRIGERGKTDVMLEDVIGNVVEILP